MQQWRYCRSCRFSTAADRFVNALVLRTGCRACPGAAHTKPAAGGLLQQAAMCLLAQFSA